MPASRGNPTRLTSLVGKGRTVERARPAHKGRASDVKLVRTQRCGLCEDDKTRFASLLEKERFLESKEKGATVGVEWSHIGIRRPGFTPPLWTGTVHR